VHLYYSGSCKTEESDIKQREDVCALLLVPGRTPTLDADARSMKLTWDDLGGGYWEAKGGLFRLYVVEIDKVAEHENDDLLRLFGHGRERTLEARRFWAEQVGTKEAMMAVHELEEYDEVVQRFLDLLSPKERLAGLSPEERLAGLAPEERLAGLSPEERLAGLPPEQRLAGLPPEQRLAGLPPEQRLAGLPPEQRLAGLPPDQALLALPDEVLRVLPDDFLATLPESTRAALRRRLGQ
jgi:hypothetical protein